MVDDDAVGCMNEDDWKTKKDCEDDVVQFIESRGKGW